VAERIRRHYGREAAVCHPPVDVDFFLPDETRRGDFLLAVGALVPYKRFDVAIDAARALGRPLVLVGEGPEAERLRARAGPSVEMPGTIPRERLRELYRTCAFFVQPGEEDFGIAAAEAVACGTPVVALDAGGVRDIVRDGEEGVLFPAGPDPGTALRDAVRRASTIAFDYTRLRRSAERFGRERFEREFRGALTEIQTLR